MMESLICFHCGLPVSGRAYYVTINNAAQPMCCIGCQMVAQAIVDNNLVHYYHFRDKTAVTRQNIIPPELNDYAQYDQPDIQKQYLTNPSTAASMHKEAILTIEGITCAACVWLLERHLKKANGIQDFSVNLSTHRGLVKWDESIIHLSDVLIQIAKIGFIAKPYQPEFEELRRQQEQNKLLKRLAIAGLGFGQVMMFAAPLYGWFSTGVSSSYRDFFRVVSLIVTTPVLAYCGYPYFKSAYHAVKSRFVTMDVSITVALIAVYLAGLYATLTQSGEVYFDSITMFLFFITLSKYLEMRAQSHSHFVIQRLKSQPPTWVTKIIDDSHILSPINRIQAGDNILIKAGELIPFDGIITSGTSSVNESLLTGEAMPKLKQTGEPVIAGSMNVDNPVTINVTRTGDDTTLAAIMRLFERALHDKPRLITLTQRFAHYFILLQIVTAVSLFAFWSFTSIDKAFWVMISILVISCPCALALGTPIAITAAMNSLSKIGFLCTRGHVLDGLNASDTVIFDKTGTLTEGNFSIVDVHLFNNYTRQDALRIAAALESRSEHPIASAFRHYKDTTVAHHIQVHPNKGIEGDIAELHYYLGNLAYIQTHLPNITTLINHDSSYTQVILANSSEAIAVFSLQDSLKPHAHDLISYLLKGQRDVHLLSGDSETNVRHYAEALGIRHYQSHYSPNDKLNYIRQLQEQGKRVVMLGDGINDAPVLMQAHVSIAMSNAADITRVNADAVLMKNDMSIIIDAFRHARKTHHVIKQCLLWAIFYNLVSLPFAVTGIVAPYLAAALMSISSILVVSNALRAGSLRRQSQSSHLVPAMISPGG